MLKRNIAILIAGGLLGAQANLAGAGDSNVYILPAQLKYLEERAASVRAEAHAGIRVHDGGGAGRRGQDGKDQRLHEIRQRRALANREICERQRAEFYVEG